MSVVSWCKRDNVSNAFVQKLSGLSTLERSETSALEAATSHARRYRAKQDLIREGDEPGPVFVILNGWACRYKILPGGSRQIMAFLMPGDACDLHMNMVAAMDHGIQAITEAKVAAISRPAMDQMMREFPGVSRALYIAQLIDEGTMRAWIVSMGRRSSIERVAHLICELYLRMRNIGLRTEGVFALPLSQIILADALGMTPVHINRVLKELREAGAMALKRGHLEILDPVKLVHIAGFDENYLHRRISQSTRKPELAGQ
ncbi:Crp/Fnr family transcriptional regulator [Sphingomonas bacterium]|uniref:Crp/Fnr family transcriptional regulator n=1 Tax=Sphingomonas bacterium TaxID=1895847 RepID=UPI0015762458|nr:Crp/Fnr family transcriptional regulator [Sphingomonas bacterium]